MLKYIVFGLTLLPIISQAASLFHDESKCKPSQEYDDISISLTHNDIANKSESQILDELKKLTFNKVQERISAQQYDYQVKDISFRHRLGKHASAQAHLKLSPVDSCINGVVIDEKHYDRLGSKLVHFKTKLQFATSRTLKLNTAFAAGKSTIENFTITPKSVFGIKIGNQLTEAEQIVGRFSATWPINEQHKIRFIGREHAFLFKNDTLIGYQYHNSLLPISFRNNLEIISNQLQIAISDTNTEKLSDLYIDEVLEQKLTSQFSNISTSRVKISEEEVLVQLQGLSIGALISKNTPVQALPCYRNNSNIDDFLSANKQSLIEIIDVDNRLSYITGCSQRIMAYDSGKVKSVELLEPFSATNAFLFAIKRMIGAIEPWQFEGVKYGGPKSQLDKFKLIQSDKHTLSVESGQWLGIFNLYDEQLTNATLYPKAL
ncbi:hypothetical protein PA25_18140 [Pseudoalteromonas sp. A25]|uniref:hypothetical protein n=1 Tax=Pseudoalteromonas sp. A25 TaxID=116092 RepID=UPI001260CDA2|nr:hypothetical protein [Pseudoalteromonas sp. A25]BBN81829.1 hypothetical protein PA25_18140 [Pseudoalteromonas sp. A25]